MSLARIVMRTNNLLCILYRTSKSDSALRALAGSFAPPRTEKTRTASGPPMLSDDMSTPTTEPEVCSNGLRFRALQLVSF